MRTMGGVSMAEFLPEGMEVIFYTGSTKTPLIPRIGVVLRNSTFNKNNGSFIDSSSDNSLGIVTTLNGTEYWVSHLFVHIVKFNPTPQEKMYYMLKGAECLPD